MAESQGGLPYKWRVLIAVVFGLFMVILDATVVNLAFRTLQEEFAANVNDSQWVISVYVMALGISTPLSGFLADRFGAKRIFVGGLAVFTIGSVACSLSQICALPPGVAPPQVYGLVQQFCGECIQGPHDAYHPTFYAALLATLLGATPPGWPPGREGRQAQARGAPAAAGH